MVGLISHSAAELPLGEAGQDAGIGQLLISLSDKGAVGGVQADHIACQRLPLPAAACPF